MKFHKIILSNFRQFYGKQEIQFSTSKSKNITLIHAENGFGKTTILNAIQWCLYGMLTEKFEKREDIINYDAIDKGVKSAYVELEFEHNNSRYFCKRDVTVGKTKKTQLKLSKLEDGSIKDITQKREPKLFLNAVLPQTMARYFFLDGEQTEALASEYNRRAVSKAIREMLGCDIADKLKLDLGYLSRKYDEDIQKLPDNDIISEEEQALKKLNDEYDLIVKTIEGDEDKLRVKKTQLLELEQELSENELTQEYQAESSQCKLKILQQKNKRMDLIERKEAWFKEHAEFLVTEKLCSHINGFFSELGKGNTTSAVIPSPYNREFVDALLQNELCICGRSLDKTSAEWNLILKLLNQAPSDVLQGKAIQAKALPKLANTKLSGSNQTYRAIEEDLLSCDSRIKELSIRLEELEKLLDGIEIEDIASKVRRREQLMNDENSLTQSISDFSKQKAISEYEITKQKEVIDELTKTNLIAKPLAEKRSICDQLIGLLDTILESYVKKAKKEMEDSINEILLSTTYRTYQMTIKEDFSLELIFREGKSVPKSQGENQLLSLAFLSALVQFAEQRSNEKDVLLRPGTNAPLVLDSPFGNLDETYRKSTAEFVPNMAGQVIILISSSQGSDTFLNVLEDKIGKEYVLICESTEPFTNSREEDSKEWITIHGTKKRIFNKGCSHNATKIEEIRNL